MHLWVLHHSRLLVSTEVAHHVWVVLCLGVVLLVRRRLPHHTIRSRNQVLRLQVRVIVRTTGATGSAGTLAVVAVAGASSMLRLHHGLRLLLSVLSVLLPALLQVKDLLRYTAQMNILAMLNELQVKRLVLLGLREGFWIPGWTTAADAGPTEPRSHEQHDALTMGQSIDECCSTRHVAVWSIPIDDDAIITSDA